jgi:hypothetical protein
MKVWWSNETKINHLGSDGRKFVWKNEGEGLSDRVVEGTVKFGGGNLMMWGCMGWNGVGYATKINGRMDGDLYMAIMDDSFSKPLNITTNQWTTSFSNRTMTPRTPARRSRSGSKTMALQSSSGLHSLQTSTPLNTFGIITKGSWRILKNLQAVLVNFGTRYKSCGRRFQKRSVRN